MLVDRGFRANHPHPGRIMLYEYNIAPVFKARWVFLLILQTHKRVISPLVIKIRLSVISLEDTNVSFTRACVDTDLACCCGAQYVCRRT